jgi:hypothetical protein
MSKTNWDHLANCGIFNSSKIKSKNRYMLNKKYKDKDNRNKKDDKSYRSKCKNPDVSSGYKTLKEMKEAA